MKILSKIFCIIGMHEWERMDIYTKFSMFVPLYGQRCVRCGMEDPENELLISEIAKIWINKNN